MPRPTVVAAHAAGAPRPGALPPALFLAPPRWHGAHCAMRSLDRLGVRVFALAHDGLSPSNLSRYCAGTFRAGTDGRPEGDAGEIVGRLLDAGRRLGGGAVLIAGTDEWAVFVAQHQAALGAEFRFPRAPAALVEKLASKRGLVDIAAAQRFPTPRIAIPESMHDVHRLAASLTYPVVVKPVLSRPDVTGKAVACTRAELMDWAQRLAESADAPNLLFQEHIPGDDTDVWMFTGYFDAQSRCVAGFTGQKLRQCPAHMGHTSLGLARFNADLAARAEAFLSAAGYRGIVDSGYRYDARDGTYKVLDVNPRVGGNFRQFVDANGLDVVRAMYLDQVGLPVRSAPQVDGRLWLKEDSDLIAFVEYRRLGELTLGAWLRSLFEVDETALFSPADPLPFFAALAALGRDYVAPRLRRLRRRRSRHERTGQLAERPTA